MAAVRAHLEGLCRKLFRLIRVSGDLRPRGPPEGGNPNPGRVLELFGEGLEDCVAAIEFIDVTGTGGALTTMVEGRGHQGEVTEPFGWDQRVSRSLQRPLVLRRHFEREVDAVQDGHKNGIVVEGHGNGNGLVCQGLATGERTSLSEL